MGARPAAGGGRRVEVAPERLERWLDGFASRHGSVTWTAGSTAGSTAPTAGPTVLTAVAADGAVAECHVPFPPLAGADGPSSLCAHALRDRCVGVLLVRLGGHAAGVFAGRRLLTSKVGTRLVHGRHKAGGQSANRFRRRREGQAAVAYAAAADVAARVLLPEVDRLDALVLGGDRRAVETVLADPRLAALGPLATDPFLSTPDPRLAVLEKTPDQFRAVSIRVVDP